MAIFSISDLKTFKRCRQLADFSISARMGLRPQVPAIYYTVGEIAHEALEMYYNGNETAWTEYQSKALEALQGYTANPRYEDIRDETLSFTYVLQAYMKRWAKRNDHFKMLNTEVRDLIELDNGHYFTFKYDGLVQKKDGSVWIKEFKTTASLPTDLAWLQIDDQAAAYQWAVEKVSGIPVVGTIYTWLRKKNPTKPKELASGGVSIAKNIVTTAEAFYDGLIALGYSPNSYTDMLKFIAGKEGGDYFLRTEVMANSKQRRYMGEHILRLTDELTNPDTYMYASSSQQNCSKCAFFGPCTAKQLGLNYKALLESDYERDSYY